MGESASDDVTISASPEAILSIITDLADYPNWAEGVESVEILETDNDGRPARAAFAVDAKVFKVNYTLVYSYGDNTVSWELVEGDQITQLDGEYRITPDGDGSKVHYALEVDLSIPLPGFMKKRGAKQILDTGLRGLKKRAEG